MTLPTTASAVTPYLVTISKLAEHDGSQTALDQTSQPRTAELTKEFSAQAGSPLNAVLSAMELFLAQDTDCHHRHIRYCINQRGEDGRAFGPELADLVDESAVHELVLSKSTRKSLPVMEMTAFLSLEGLPVMFWIPVRARTPTGAYMAVKQAVDMLAPILPALGAKFVVFEGNCTPVDGPGHQVSRLLEACALPSAPVLRQPNNTTNGRYTLFHGDRAPLEVVKKLPKLRRKGPDEAPLVVLPGTPRPLNEQILTNLLNWFDEGRELTECEEVLST